MLLRLSKMISRSNCILILVMSNLANSAPLKSRKRLPNEGDPGFSASPRILEIQLPLKITSKEDLVAWSKYVMSLVTSKVNFTSIGLKDTSSVGTQHEKQVSFVNNSASKSKETMKKGSLADKRQGLNYPARRLKGPHVQPHQEPQRADDKVVAYPLPIGGTKPVSKLSDPFVIPTANINGRIDQQLQFGQFANFNGDNLFPQDYSNNFRNLDVLAQQPAAMYLPLPMRPPDVATYQNTISENISSFESPTKYQTSNSFDLRIKALNDELGQVLPSTTVINDLTRKNLSPLLTFPFQAVITITRQLPADATTSKTQTKEYFAAKNPPDKFSPYSEKNYTVKSKTGQINVIFNDVITDTNKKEKEKIVEEEEEEEEEEGNEDEEEEQDTRGDKRNKNEKKAKNAKQKSRKRQSSTFGDLLRNLGILRRPPKNTTEISVATPIASILKGTNSQKIQVAFEEPLSDQERRNETQSSEAQELDESDNAEQQEEEEEEEEGGSIQALIELLPLAAPILEDLSDPESDINIAEVLQGAIPLLEGLSDPNEEGGVDIPSILVPLSQKLSEGEDGQSDSAGILGPIIQLTAPLIGPIVGPLIGPLSRISSGPGGKQGLVNLLTDASGTLSQPGPDGQSIFSNIIASVSAGLSKAFADSAGESDVQALVRTVVTGLLAGTSSASSAAKNKTGGSYGPPNNGRPYQYGPNNNGRPYQNDTYYAPTNYGSYGSYYGPQGSSTNIKDMLKSSLQQLLGAFLKLSAASSTSSANLSASSSSSSTTLIAGSSEGSLDSSKPQPQQPMYGAPAPANPPYQPPAYQPARPTSYSSTNSPYASLFARRQVRPIKRV